jgi:secreted trypsin-like serine protease
MLKNIKLENEDKIVGGQPADEGDIPFQVQMNRYSYPYLVCGGAILDSMTILTAAHCCAAVAGDEISITYGSLKKDAEESDGGTVSFKVMYTVPKS